MLKAKPVWFSLDVFKADPGGYNATHASVARALERAFTGRAVTGEYTGAAPCALYESKIVSRLRRYLRRTRDLSKFGRDNRINRRESFKVQQTFISQKSSTK